MGVNDVFTVGDFPITVKEANGSNGVYSGWGYVTYPFLGNSRIKVVFNNVSINTDYQLFEGVVETDYDPDWSNIVDVDALIKGVEDLFSEIENNIDAITDTIAEQAASGELSPEEAAAATQEVIAAQTEINEVQEKVDQKKEELKKEEAKDPKDEEKIADLKKEVAQGKDQLDQISRGLGAIAEQLGVSNNEDSQVGDDTYFDGIISISSTNGQNTQLPLDSNTSVSFTELNQDVFATENPLFVATLNNSKFIITHSKTPEKTLDSIKQLLANPKSTEFLLWEHYDLENKKFKYKVAYGAAHESKIGLKHPEYILLFNSLLERPQTDFIGSVVIRGSQGLNDLAEETKNYILPELKRNYSISRSVYEYLKLLIDLFDKCSEGQTSGIVPKCLWNQEYNKGIAYAAGIIDGVWEIAELTWSLAKVRAAWDPSTGLYASAEGIEIRKKTVDVINNIAQLYEEDKLASTLGENINAGFEKYSKEISKLDAKGRYLQGKLVFDVASFFFGVGEVKTLIKTGKITSSTAQALARIPENVMGLINRIPGKIKLIKNNILAYAVSINTYIEIARIGGDDLVVLPGKWVSAPTLVLDDLGELSLKTTADTPRTTAHIGVVKKGDNTGLGLVDDVAKAGVKNVDDYKLFWNTLSDVPKTSQKQYILWRRVDKSWGPAVTHPMQANNTVNRYSKGREAVYFGRSKEISNAEWLSYNPTTGLRGPNGSKLYKFTVNESDLLDLTDPNVLSKLDLKTDLLTKIDDKAIPQALGDWAFDNGYKGIIFPSARMGNEANVVIFKYFQGNTPPSISVTDLIETID